MQKQTDKTQFSVIAAIIAYHPPAAQAKFRTCLQKFHISHTDFMKKKVYKTHLIL